jgi:glucose 1-dehydrogenase
MRLQGKVALVTGGSRGIGRGIVERFAREGADVVINYTHRAEAAQEALAAVRAAGRDGLVVQADVGRVADVRLLVAESAAHFGRLDVLVNNAGIEKNADFWAVTEADYDAVLNVNSRTSPATAPARAASAC